MMRACLCDIDRSGLAAAMRARGIQATHVDRQALASVSVERQGLVLGWRPSDSLIVPVRRAWRGPLMLVLSDGGETDLVRALDDGADEAMLARAGDALIAARLSALLRRSRAAPLIRLGSLAIDPVERRVMREGRRIDLLPREYALLLHLVRHEGEIVGRAALREAVWGLDFDPGTNVIEVHVSRLRSKLDRGFAIAMLQTEKGRGYRLATDGQSPIAGIARAV